MLIALLLVTLVFTVLGSGSEARQEQSLTQFIESAKAGEVRSVEVDGVQIKYKLSGNDPTTYKAKMERGDTVRAILQDAGIQPENFSDIQVHQTSPVGNLLGIIMQLLPVVLIPGTLYYFFRRAQVQARVLTIGGVSETDPVCGRRVSPGESAGSSTFQNVTYRFCSPKHKQEFDSDPVKYLLEK